ASPVAVAVAVFCPAVALKVHDVAAAIPSTPVATGVVGVTVPLPGLAAKVTPTPETGLPLASRTITDGGGVTAVPAGADVPPPFGAIEAAVPALSAMGPELARKSVVQRKRGVSVATGTLNGRPVNVAAAAGPVC